MKAYNLYGINDLRYEDIEKPALKDGWALVKVKAAGICSSDIPRIFTKGTYHFPTIPGHELSGVVEIVANDKDKYLLGKRVGIFPLIPCKKCEQCHKGHYEMCQSYDYVGSRRDGAYAEYITVPVWNLIEFSNDIAFEVIAMMEPLAVALHAMKQAKLVKGESVAIIGTGMIGFAAAQWAQKLGAKSVTVIGRTNDKKVIADAIYGIGYITIKQIAQEYDVVLEAVGSASSIDLSINIVKPAGKVVLMGNPEGDILFSQATYWRVLRKQLQIVGTWNSSYENGIECDWTEVKDALMNKEIQAKRLISHYFRQDELDKGLCLMKDHKEPYCKVMTLWNE